LRIDAALREAGLRSRMLLQVHDELVFEVWPGEREPLEQLVRAQMGGAYELSVPLEVSVGVGRTWDDAGHLARGSPRVAGGAGTRELTRQGDDRLISAP